MTNTQRNDDSIMKWPTKLPLVAILRGIEPDEVYQHISQLIKLGYDCIEIPLNSPHWEKSISKAVTSFEQKAMIGAGTVLNTKEVKILHNIGAKFIVTPNTNKSVIIKAKRKELFTCIGCMTPTEAITAIRHGAQSLKLFPAGNLGTDYIKAIKAILPKEIPIIAVGGVNADNMKEFLNAGCTGIGFGSEIYKKGQSPEQTYKNALIILNSYNNII